MKSENTDIDSIHLQLIRSLGLNITIKCKMCYNRNASITGMLLSIKPDREYNHKENNEPQKLITIRTIEKGEIVINTTDINDVFFA
jgi:hypothetical protein